MIRTEFSNRIAAQIGTDPAKFNKTLNENPQYVTTTPTEAYESVELGFEKAAKFTADAVKQFKNNPSGLKVAADQARKENPKAFDAFGEFVLQTSAGAQQSLSVSDYIGDQNGVFSVQVKGQNLNGTLWIDTTPGENNIQSLLLDNTKTHGPNPAIPPRAGEVTNEPAVDAKVLGPVQQEVGADKVFTGLKDENLQRFVDWSFGRNELPFGTPLQALPTGWQEVGQYDSHRIGEGENYIVGQAWGSHQVLNINKETETVSLQTCYSYRRPTDFEGSLEEVTLTQYKDGEIRKQSREMHD